MPVDTPHPDYIRHSKRWQRCRDCYSGSDAVKERGTEYLPYLDSHKKAVHKGRYEEYRLRALYFNATRRTVQGLSGAIFQKTPTFKVPKVIEDQLDDITMTSIPAELFALHSTQEVMTPGRYGILVEMEPTVEGEAVTKLKRPYWCGFRAEDIISWETNRFDGNEMLVRVVLRVNKEKRKVDDEFVKETYVQYRVLELVNNQYQSTTWEKNTEANAPSGQKNEYIKGETFIPTRRGQPLNFIPFTFIGPTSISVNVEDPPLLDLVDISLSHYRTMADLEHGRHFTALPTPWIAGAAGGPQSDELSIGSGVAWNLDVNGKAGMLEFSGAGLKALVDADEGKRRMMAVLGARLLEDISGIAETATAVSMRHAGEHATLRTITQAVEQGLTEALRRYVWWLGTEETPEDLTDVLVELNKDFFSIRMSSADLQTQVMAFQAGAISFKTFYYNLTRGDITRPGIDADEEEQEIARQDPLLGAPKAPPPSPDDDDEEDDDEDDDEKPPPPTGKKPPPGKKSPKSDEEA